MTEIYQHSAADLAEAVRSGRLSAVEVAQAHLDRSQAVNPAINAVVQHFPEEVLAEAASVDAQLLEGEDPGPMCGVPVTIKVNVDQTGHATTNGLALQKDLIAQADSPVVSNLRKAGAVIVGRTNTPAFSLRWFTSNGLHGQTLNPRDKRLTPGGSSGGAASAVAAGLCAVGHGTDIAGSIRYPAYACGLHGLRPTVGRVPAYNASGAERFIGAQLMAVSGPIARSIEDIALAFRAMAAADPRDPWWAPGLETAPETPKRAVLALAPDGMPVAAEVTAALTGAAHALEAAGWRVEETACPPMREPAELNAQLWMAETAFAAREMMAAEADPDAMFVFQQMTRLTGPVDMERLMRALQRRASLVREWEVFLQDTPLVLCPVSGELPFAQQRDVQSVADFEAIYEAQLTQRGLPTLGLPSLAVSTGVVGTAPVGVQLVAERFREDVLLDAGSVIERAGDRPAVTDPR